MSPKEILSALDLGHAVYGAGSMGALRAVECERFGMRGAGEVFRLFREGTIDRDDEVACAYDPETHAALTEPLVCLREALEAATEEGLIRPDDAERLIEQIADWPWRLRSLASVVRSAGLDEPSTHALASFMRDRADLKERDAEEVLRLVARGFAPPEVPDGGVVDLPQRGVPLPAIPPLASLEATPKIGAWDSTRSIVPTETAARLDHARPLVGITRVADITGLDTIGIPNTIAVRPSRDRMCNSAYSGKGLRLLDALVGGQMEALEVAVGHDDRLPMHKSSWSELHERGLHAVHPDRLIPLPGAPFELTDMSTDWLMGSEIRSGEARLLPADCCVFRRSPVPRIWKISSNGLASGNTVVEAMSHALAEVIERDAESHFRLATEYADLPGLLGLVAGPPRVAAPSGALAPPRDFPLIGPGTLPVPLRDLVARVRAAGIDLALRLITSDIAIPTILCAVHEETTDDRRHLVQYGCGSHPDPRIAARRAITEATQSRVTAIQGSREDLAAGAICPADPPAEWFDPESSGIDFADIPTTIFSDVRDDIGCMLDALDTAALDPAVVVNLTNDAIGFPVVKVIVPGMELAFHTIDPELVAFGWRGRRYLPAS